MKIGVLLPTFRSDARDALSAAQRASEQQLDGVFAYDHLWPMGESQRPSLAPFPVLANVAARERSLFLGPLVARVGLVGTQVLVEEFLTLSLIAPSRVIVALGTGDKLSEAENVAYGLTVRSAHERRTLLAETATALAHLEVWVGAGSTATNVLARELDAVLNFWNSTPDELVVHAKDGPVSWAGNAREDVEHQMDELRDAGSTWAVFSPATSVARLGAWRRANNESQ